MLEAYLNNIKTFKPAVFAGRIREYCGLGGRR
jgi:hypothetical protein